MNLFLCGDIHGDATPIKNFYRNYIKDTPGEKEENWLIMLGDFGANYYFDHRDRNFKKELSKYPFHYFVIRGNHEQRASLCAHLEPDVWEEVEVFGNKCLRQSAFPDIYYARDDGGIYNIAGRKTLVIPGAYSVDKYYRLMRGWSWFAEEQLNDYEKEELLKEAAGQHFDLVLSHTCFYSAMPRDAFLPSIDQSTVDNSMEIFMEKLKENITFSLWLWAHYHLDRVELPYCEIFYHEVENLLDIEDRWKKYTKTKEIDWWIPKSPNFYMWTEEEK